MNKTEILKKVREKRDAALDKAVKDLLDIGDKIYNDPLISMPPVQKKPSKPKGKFYNFKMPKNVRKFLTRP